MALVEIFVRTVMKHERQCLTTFPNTEKIVENSTRSEVFFTSRCLESGQINISLEFDISSQSKLKLRRRRRRKSSTFMLITLSGLISVVETRSIINEF